MGKQKKEGRQFNLIIYSQILTELTADNTSLLILNHCVSFFLMCQNASQMSRLDGSDACYQAFDSVSFCLWAYHMNSQYTPRCPFILPL